MKNRNCLLDQLDKKEIKFETLKKSHKKQIVIA